MILKCLILNNQKEEVFLKNFVERNFYNEFQIKTIEDTLARLLRIVEILSKANKEEQVAYKQFTVTNLWISIFKTQNHYFIFISPSVFTQNKKPLDLKPALTTLMNDLELLIFQCTRNEPHFDLSINKYFESTAIKYVRSYNLSEITKYESIKVETSKTLEKQVENKYKETLNKKYLILGVGAVGKSSIISQFFDNWNMDQLQGIKPTIFKKINKYSDTFLDHNFTMIDLGGQEIYLQQHLSDENLFRNIRTIIYVIDVQNERKISSTQKYLNEILEILHLNNEKPFFSVFLHKYDPDKKNLLENNVQFWFTWIDETFSNYNIPFSYYLTSIFDKSARESLARTLLLTIPNWFLALIIKKDLIYRSFNSLLPILSDIDQTSIDENDNFLRMELFDNSIIFGQSVTKIILQNWIAHLMKDESYSITFEDIKGLKNTVLIEFNEEVGLTELKFKCPLLERNIDEKYTKNKNICSLTHGLLTGLCQFTGLGKVTIVETQIRNKSEFCSFTILL